MSAKPAQPALFPCGAGFQPARRGWSALAKRHRVVEIEGRNAAGRVKLTFDYRPLHAWTPQQLDQAEALVELYFRHFGGFRKADQAVMRAWVEALSDFTVDQVKAAMRKKWRTINKGDKSAVADARQFIARPENFPATIGRWWDQSPEALEVRQKAEKQAETKRVDDIRARLAEGDSNLSQRPDRAARQAEADARRRAFWDALTISQRKAATAATRDTWRTLCANYGWREESDEAVEHHQVMAAKWAMAQWPSAGGTK